MNPPPPYLGGRAGRPSVPNRDQLAGGFGVDHATRDMRLKSRCAGNLFSTGSTVEMTACPSAACPPDGA
jgi:hypothetical protein